MNKIMTIGIAIMMTFSVVDARTSIEKGYKKSNKSLRSALSKHAKPFAKNKQITGLDDIMFSFSHKTKANNIINLAKQKLGQKYVWGAVGQKGTFDCSGLTKYVYQKSGINIPRTSINQSKYGQYIARSQLKAGDLVFFDTSKEKKGYVNHVGIYIGNGKFLHASSAYKKVVISKLDKTFYGKRFKVARRP